MTPDSNSALQPSDATPEVERPAGGQLGRRVFGNYVFHSMNWGIRLLEQLLLIPLFFFAWGTKLYSDWLVVTSIVVFLGSCAFGLDDYFGNKLLRLASLRDDDGFRKELKTALFVTCMLSLGLALLLLCTLSFVPITDVVSLSSMDARTAALIIIIMTPTWIGLPVWIVFAIYRAYGEFSRGERVSGVFMVLQLASVAVALALRLTPVLVASTLCVTSLLRSAFILFDVSRRYPAVAFGFARLEKGEWRRMVRQSLQYFASPLSSGVAQSGPPLVFAFFGVAANTIVSYNIFRVLTGVARQFGIASFALGSGIEMARQFAQGHYDACRRFHDSSGRIVSCLGGILAGLTVAVSGPFVRLWTHGAVTNNETLVLCFLVGIFFAAPGRVSLMLLRYTNHAAVIGFSSCIYAIGGLALALALERPFGGIGVALAFAITEILGLGLYPSIAAGKLFRIGVLRHLAGSYLAGLCAFALSYLVARALFGGAEEVGFVGLAVRLAVWAILASPVCAFLALSASQRAQLGSSGGRLWRRLMRTARA